MALSPRSAAAFRKFLVDALAPAKPDPGIAASVARLLGRGPAGGWDFLTGRRTASPLFRRNIEAIGL